MEQAQIDATLQKGIKAARRGHKEPAQKLLSQVLQEDPSLEEAWLWLSKVVDQPAQKIKCLEQVVQLNPDNMWAAEQLQSLQAPPDASSPAAETAATPQAPEPVTAGYDIEALNCPNCGSALDIKGGKAIQAVVCDACSSVIDLTPAQAQVIGQAGKKGQSQLPIELGTEFDLAKSLYQVVGWLRYEGWDDEDRWRWEEWLLASADGEFRWLIYDPEAGFSLQKKIPVTSPIHFQQNSISVPDGEARVTERAQAKVVALEGELTWRANVGEHIRYMDAKAGDRQYAVEFNRDEVELHVGKPVPEENVWQSLGNQAILDELQKQKGVRRNYKRLAIASAVFLLLSFCTMFATVFMGSEIFQQNLSLSRGQPALTEPYTVNNAGRIHEVSLTASNPSDKWGAIEVNAVDEQGRKSLLFTKTFGDNDAAITHFIRPEQNGTYQLEVLLKDGSQLTANVIVGVRAGIWDSTLFFCFAIPVGIIGFIAFILGRGAAPPYSHTLAARLSRGKKQKTQAG